MDSLDNRSFQDILQLCVIPSPTVEKMGDRSAMAWAAVPEVGGLPTVSIGESSGHDSYNMLDQKKKKKLAQT